MEELKIGPPGAGVITGKRSPFLEKNEALFVWYVLASYF